MGSSLCLCKIPECAKEWISASVSVSHVFFGHFPFCLFILTYSDVLVFGFFLLYFTSLFLPNEKQNWGESGWKGRWRGIRGSRVRENHNQDI